MYLSRVLKFHSPAFGENGTFSGELYAAEAVRVIVDHSTTYPDQPLFMYLAWHLGELRALA